jgi:3-oxoacyl-[acyl-carrier-protein] synthase II
MTLELHRSGFPSLLGYLANSDACDPLGMPKDGGRSIQLIREAIARHGHPSALCPHATGTAVHAISEPAALKAGFSETPYPSLHLLKPFTGHTIGASGLVEAAILASFLSRGKLPPNLPDRSSIPGFHLPDSALDASGPLFKLSHSMGGHNALLVLSPS